MQQFDTIAVIGAGTMGHTIALVCATRGKKVFLVDVSVPQLEHAKEKMRASLAQLMDNGLVASGDPDEIINAVTYTADTSVGVAEADLIIEAAPENKDLKRKIYAGLEAAARTDAVFASNTSGIPINCLAAMTRRPERFIGLHFYQPGHLIPLVEVVQGDNTPDALVKDVLEFVRGLGKKPVWVRKDIPGFIGNRLQHALSREAMSLMQKGIASAEDIDTVVKSSLALRMVFTGPIEQRDFNGLDIHVAVAEYLYPDLEDAKHPLAVLKDRADAGDLGIKTGKGFFDWRAKDIKKISADKHRQLMEIIKLASRLG